MVARVLVGFTRHPGWGVAHPEEENFPGGDQMVERLHQFGDRGGKIPPVHVELSIFSGQSVSFPSYSDGVSVSGQCR